MMAHHSSWEAACFQFALEHEGEHLNVVLDGKIIPKVRCAREGEDRYLIFLFHETYAEDFCFDGQGTVHGDGRTLPGRGIPDDG